jgi:hypothetical protein
VTTALTTARAAAYASALEARSAPIRAQLAACTDAKERRRLKAELRAIRRELGRLRRAANW